MTSAQQTGMRRRSLLVLSLAARRAALLALSLVTFTASVPAATLERLSLDDAIRKSTQIVRAKVLDSYADFRGSVIYTHWKLQVVERLKGPDQPSVEVLIPGGKARGYRQDVAGAPRLLQGQEYLLFLWTAKSGSTYITGLSQGVFELPKNASGDLMATRAASSETMLDRQTWQPVQDDAVQMVYTDLTSYIAAALARVGNQ